MRVLFRKWRRRWIAIDLLALGVGLALSVWYYIHVKNKPWGRGEQALETLWPNIATELIGVWLSVRIIDALVRARDERSGNRHAVVNDLRYIVNRASHVIRMDSYALEDLRNVVGGLAEANVRWARSLTHDELKDVNAVMRAATEAERLGQQLHRADRRAEKALDALPYDKLEDVRECFRRARRHDWDELSNLQAALGRGGSSIQSDIEREVLDAVANVVATIEQLKQSLSRLTDTELRARKNILDEELE